MFIDKKKLAELQDLESFLEVVGLLDIDKLNQEDLDFVIKCLENLSSKELKYEEPKVKGLIIKLLMMIISLGGTFLAIYKGIDIPLALSGFGTFYIFGTVIECGANILGNNKKQKNKYVSSQKQAKKILKDARARAKELELENIISEPLDESIKPEMVDNKLNEIRETELFASAQELYNFILSSKIINKEYFLRKLYAILQGYTNLKETLQELKCYVSSNNIQNESYQEQIYDLRLEAEAYSMSYSDEVFSSSFANHVESFKSQILSGADVLKLFGDFKKLVDILFSLNINKEFLLQGYAYNFWLAIKYVNDDERQVLVNQIKDEYLDAIISHANCILSYIPDTGSALEIKDELRNKIAQEDKREYVKSLLFALDKLNVFNKAGFKVKN